MIVFVTVSSDLRPSDLDSQTEELVESGRATLKFQGKLGTLNPNGPHLLVIAAMKQ